jgi:hypothetical protein
MRASNRLSMLWLPLLSFSLDSTKSTLALSRTATMGFCRFYHQRRIIYILITALLLDAVFSTPFG